MLRLATSRAPALHGALLGFSLLLGAAPALSQEIQILVANKGTPAWENAQKKADDKTTFAERRLHKALERAAELLNEKCPKCPEPRVRGMAPPPCDLKQFCSVNIKVASGEYTGKGGNSGFAVPEIKNVDSTLRVLGGYDDEFTKRAPFDTPTIVRVGGTAFAFQGKDPALKELYFSGFLIDIGDGNKYDGKTNSLLKGTSANVSILTFGYLTTDRLVIADNLFLNSSHKVAAPAIRAKSAQAELVIRNNFLVNNIYAWQVGSASGKVLPGVYRFEGNSVLFNWPYNPDPTTSNPAALEIGNKYSAATVVLTDNLFAYNPGGAIYATQAEKVGPPLTIKNNLFFSNGALFDETDPGAGAVVGKFGAFKSRKIPWNVIPVDILEDDYDFDSDGNVVMDPKVPLVMVKAGFANSSGVEAEKTVVNDVRSILGMNLQGGSVKISNYAPRVAIDPKKLPFPEEPKAQKYGVRRDRVEQF